MAFHYFSKQKVDIAIIEVGLGGRLDSTNIIHPDLSIITNIGLDHTELLGDSLEKIAMEKGGIIKPKTPILIGRKQSQIKNIFNKIAKQNQSSLYYAKNCNYKSDLKGSFQKENKNIAYTAINILRKKEWNIKEKHIISGLKNIKKNTSFMGRWMTLSKVPYTICDSGHNIDSIKLIVEQLKKISYNNLHMVFGMVNDKAIDIILELLPKKQSTISAKQKIPRSMNSKTILLKSKRL